MKPNEMIVVQRGDGQPLTIGPATGLVGRAEWTGGAYSIMDQLVPPGIVVPVHSHAIEDQVVFVLAGTLTCWVDGHSTEVHEGGYALRPAGLPHSMWNATGTDVRILEITSPATRFQEYIGRIGALFDQGNTPADELMALAADYGVTFYPDLTDELRQTTGF